MTLTLITDTHRVFVIVINEDVGSLHDLTGENYWQQVECIAGVRGEYSATSIIRSFYVATSNQW